MQSENVMPESLFILILTLFESMKLEILTIKLDTDLNIIAYYLNTKFKNLNTIKIESFQNLL